MSQNGTLMHKGVYLNVFSYQKFDTEIHKNSTLDFLFILI